MLKQTLNRLTLMPVKSTKISVDGMLYSALYQRLLHRLIGRSTTQIDEARQTLLDQCAE
jgi:hypothetical protein